ncbi:hypothetical protein Bbelb_345560 [Branchiostoma belcheri]|nr:hypothetical protein Bbelb_345560 [Branchiostoma belcheri]
MVDLPRLCVKAVRQGRQYREEPTKTHGTIDFSIPPSGGARRLVYKATRTREQKPGRNSLVKGSVQGLLSGETFQKSSSSSHRGSPDHEKHLRFIRHRPAGVFVSPARRLDDVRTGGGLCVAGRAATTGPVRWNSLPSGRTGRITYPVLRHLVCRTKTWEDGAYSKATGTAADQLGCLRFVVDSEEHLVTFNCGQRVYDVSRPDETSLSWKESLSGIGGSQVCNPAVQVAVLQPEITACVSTPTRGRLQGCPATPVPVPPPTPHNTRRHELDPRRRQDLAVDRRLEPESLGGAGHPLPPTQAMYNTDFGICVKSRGVSRGISRYLGSGFRGIALGILRNCRQVGSQNKPGNIISGSVPTNKGALNTVDCGVKYTHRCLLGCSESPANGITARAFGEYLQPIDLLARALEYQRYLPSGTDITIDRAHRIHAISFSPDTGTLQGVNFPSNRVFLNCEYFPEEFSILVTLKARLNMKGNQYILSLVQERVHNIRLAIRITRFKVFFDYSSSGGHVVKKSSPSFATEIADGEWHTFVITVTGNDVGLTVDCRPPYFTYLDRTFPAYLDTTGTKFHIGNKRRRKEQFTGQLHQLVLLPGADASTMVCPSLNPQLARMDLPSPFPKDLVPQHNNAPDHQSDAHMKVEMGDDSVCTNGDVGRMWFDTKSGSMKLCDGLGWIAVADAGNSRIDYLDVHQDVYTPANTIDIETFYIEGEGLFMATANHDARLDKELESSIFKWTNGEFVVHQNIKTYGAQEWEHFVIDGQTFLAVANYGGTSGMETNSRVYRWEPKLKRFALHQEMVTFNARDWEAFEIDGEHYLVVANHARGLDHNIESVIFHWERAGDYFVPYQTIPTKAAYDWEAFTIGPYHFLAVANAYNGVSTKVDSVIYVWQYGRFLPLQFVETMGCTDWEYMNIGKEHFLVAANAFNHGPHALDSSYRYSINSTIYKLNVQKQRFEEFQNILTHSATDWESFRVGRDNYLVVANSYDDGESNDVDSVVYRWQGVEKFKPVHNIPTTSCADWEFFQMHGESFLVYANAKGRTRLDLGVPSELRRFEKNPGPYRVHRLQRSAQTIGRSRPSFGIAPYRAGEVALSSVAWLSSNELQNPPRSPADIHEPELSYLKGSKHQENS